MAYLTQLLPISLILATTIGCGDWDNLKSDDSSDSNQPDEIFEEQTGDDDTSDNEEKICDFDVHSWKTPPDVAGCTTITGDLTVSTSASAEEIAGLNSLEYINGDFILSINPSLETLPFGKLKEVKGDVAIRGTRHVKLEDLSDLKSLTKIGGDLIMSTFNHSAWLRARYHDSILEVNGSICWLETNGHCAWEEK